MLVIAVILIDYLAKLGLFCWKFLVDRGGKDLWLFNPALLLACALFLTF